MKSVANMLPIVLVSLASWGFASPLLNTFSKVHESASRSAFRQLNAVAPDAIIPIRVGLTQQNLEQGYDYLMNVSDPASKSYGKHWTREEVNSAFAPSTSTVNQVRDWLSSAGINNVRQSSNQGWIAFETSAMQAEQLLNAKYHEYENPRDGTIRIGCDEYSLPSHISPLIDYITPAVTLSAPIKTSQIAVSRKLRRRNSAAGYSRSSSPAQLDDLQGCSRNVTPPCLRALYDIPYPSTNINAGIIGIFESEDSYSQDDLNLFFENYAPYVPQGTHPELVSINNATAPVNSSSYANGGESDIDFDLAYSILGAVNITLYEVQTPSNYSGSSTLVDPLLDAVDASYCDAEQQNGGFQCGGDNLTLVLSGSYSTPELFGGSRVSQERACNEFMKLGLQGHTILYSSGDYGVASNPYIGSPLCLDDGCVPADLQMGPYYYFNGPIFSPGFPANCPYVLTVGGTMIRENATVDDPEWVMNLPSVNAGCNDDGEDVFSSSGGFSNYFQRLSYQENAVSNYFAQYDPGYPYYEANDADVTSNATNIGANGGIYNRPGRAFPDVSANGAHASTYLNGKLISQDGTSLSTPIWASLIALLNQQRADAGQSPVGFVHPVLYAHPEVFHDITNGTNPGCGTQGFSAVEGWDPTTGLGTPNFPALAALFQEIASS